MVYVYPPSGYPKELLGIQLVERKFREHILIYTHRHVLIILLRDSQSREHLKYVWTVYRVITNQMQECQTTETTDNEWVLWVTEYIY